MRSRPAREPGVPLARFTRPPWTPQAGDRWQVVPDLDAAAEALGPESRRVFLTTGRLELAPFRQASQHHYVVRTIDPPPDAELPAHCELVLAKGPFSRADEEALMRRHRVEVLVSKNSGGTGAAKLDAARALGLPVVMVDRPRQDRRRRGIHDPRRRAGLDRGSPGGLLDARRPVGARRQHPAPTILARRQAASRSSR